MDLELFVTLFVVITNGILAILVITSGARKRINRYFFFFLLFIILWKLSLFYYLETNSSEYITLIGRINFATSILLGYFGILFSNIFPTGNPFIKNRKITLSFNL